MRRFASVSLIVFSLACEKPEQSKAAATPAAAPAPMPAPAPSASAAGGVAPPPSAPPPASNGAAADGGGGSTAAAPVPSPAPPSTAADVAQALAVPPKPPSLVEDVRQTLEQHGVTIARVERIPKIGRPGCAEQKRDRFVISNNVHVDMSRFATPQAAAGCFSAFQKQLGPTWPKIGQNFLVHGRWMAETSENATVQERDSIRRALNEAL